MGFTFLFLLLFKIGFNPVFSVTIRPGFKMKKKKRKNNLEIIGSKNSEFGQVHITPRLLDHTTKKINMPSKK